MSYTGFDPSVLQSIRLGDSENLDAFGRLRVATPTMIFDSKAVRGAHEDLLWVTDTNGTGAVTHDDDGSSELLQVTANTDVAMRQSRGRMVYQSGLSMLHYFSFVTPVEDANVEWRVGYFDANDGVFLGWDGTRYTIVLRSSTSGSPVDTVVLRGDWTDPMDGSGPSGITKTLGARNVLLWIDLQWLAVGRVRVGFVLDGVAHVAHAFDASDAAGGAYMRNPNLVHRSEIVATGAPGATRTLEAICSAAFSEGPYNPLGLTSSASNGRTGIAVTDTYGELIAVRLAAGTVDRQTFLLQTLALLCSTGGNVHFLVVLNPTGMGTGAWVALGAQSGLEVNVTRGTGWTRGSEDHVLYEGYFSANQDAIAVPMDTRITLGAQVDGTADVIAVVAANATGVGAETIFCAATLREVF